MTFTNNDDQLRKPIPSLTLTLFVWFHRIIASGSLYLGVNYWISLIGIHPGNLGRFDLMPVYWQASATSLAVLFPVAAIGLWTVVSWGPVIWVVAALGECIMYIGFPELFGSRDVVLLAHGFVALLYLIFRLVLYREHQIAAR